MKKYILFTVSFIIIGYILLAISMLIPNVFLLNNVQDSAYTLNAQGDYPTLYFNGAFLENFCDADYIAVAFNQRTNNPLYNAIDAYNYCYDASSGANRGVQGLAMTFSDEDLRIYEHSHGWHGYRIFLRPLLTIYSVMDIRWLLTSLCDISVIIICVLIYKVRNRLLDFIPFIVAYSFFNYKLETLSIAIAINMLLMLIPCIAVLVGCMTQKEAPYFMMVMYIAGMASAYFALFDLPLLSVAFPIVMRLAYDKNITDKVQNVLKMILFWGLGCALEFFPKLLIHELFMDKHSGTYAISWYLGFKHDVQIMERLTKGSDLLDQALSNSKVTTDIFVLLALLLIVICIMRKGYKRFSIHDAIAYMFIAFLPFFWIFTMIIASNIPWVVFIFSISVFSILQFLWMLVFPLTDN